MQSSSAEQLMQNKHSKMRDEPVQFDEIRKEQQVDMIVKHFEKALAVERNKHAHTTALKLQGEQEGAQLRQQLKSLREQMQAQRQLHLEEVSKLKGQLQVEGPRMLKRGDSSPPRPEKTRGGGTLGELLRSKNPKTMKKIRVVLRLVGMAVRTVVLTWAERARPAMGGDGMAKVVHDMGQTIIELKAQLAGGASRGGNCCSAAKELKSLKALSQLLANFHPERKQLQARSGTAVAQWTSQAARSAGAAPVCGPPGAVCARCHQAAPQWQSDGRWEDLRQFDLSVGPTGLLSEAFGRWASCTGRSCQAWALWQRAAGHHSVMQLSVALRKLKTIGWTKLGMGASRSSQMRRGWGRWCTAQNHNKWTQTTFITHAIKSYTRLHLHHALLWKWRIFSSNRKLRSSNVRLAAQHYRWWMMKRVLNQFGSSTAAGGWQLIGAKLFGTNRMAAAVKALRLHRISRWQQVALNDAGRMWRLRCRWRRWVLASTSNTNSFGKGDSGKARAMALMSIWSNFDPEDSGWIDPSELLLLGALCAKHGLAWTSTKNRVGGQFVSVGTNELGAEAQATWSEQHNLWLTNQLDLSKVGRVSRNAWLEFLYQTLPVEQGQCDTILELMKQLAIKCRNEDQRLVELSMGVEAGPVQMHRHCSARSLFAREQYEAKIRDLKLMLSELRLQLGDGALGGELEVDSQARSDANEVCGRQRAECETTRLQLSQTDNQLEEDFRLKCKKQQIQLEKQTSHMAELNEELRLMSESKGVVIEQYDTSIATQLTTVQELHMQIEQLKHQLGDSKAHELNLQQKLNKLEAELKALRESGDTDVQTMCELQARISQLLKELDAVQQREAAHLIECEQAHNGHLSKIAELEGKLGASLSRGGDRISECDDLEQRLKELKDTNESLEEQLRELRRQLQDMLFVGEKQQEDDEAEKTHLETQLEEQSASASQFKEQVNELQDKCTEVEAELEQEQTKVAQVSEQLGAAEHAAAESQEKLQHTEATVQHAQTGTEALELDLLQLGHELTAARWTAASAMWTGHISHGKLLRLTHCVVRWQRCTARALLDSTTAGQVSAFWKIALRTMKKIMDRWKLVPQACCVRTWLKNKARDDVGFISQLATLKSHGNSIRIFRTAMERWRNLAFFGSVSNWKAKMMVHITDEYEIRQGDYEVRQAEDNDDINAMGSWLATVEQGAENAVTSLNNSLFVVGAVHRAWESLQRTKRALRLWQLQSSFAELFAGSASGGSGDRSNGSNSNKTGTDENGNGSGNADGLNSQSTIENGANETGNQAVGGDGVGSDAQSEEHPFRKKGGAVIGRNVCRWWAQACVFLAVALVQSRWHYSLLLARWHARAASAAGSASNLGSLLDRLGLLGTNSQSVIRSWQQQSSSELKLFKLMWSAFFVRTLIKRWASSQRVSRPLKVLLMHRDEVLASGMQKWISVHVRRVLSSWHRNLVASLMLANLLRISASVLGRLTKDVKRMVIRLLATFRLNMRNKTLALYMIGAIMIKWLGYNMSRTLQVWSERFRLETAFEMALVNKKQKESLEMEKNSEIYKCKQDRSAALGAQRAAEEEQQRLRAQLDEMLGQENAAQKVLLEEEAKRFLEEKAAGVSSMLIELEGKRDAAAAAEQQAIADSANAKVQIEETEQKMAKLDEKLANTKALLDGTAAELEASQIKEQELRDSISQHRDETIQTDAKVTELEADLTALEHFAGVRRKEHPVEIKADEGAAVAREPMADELARVKCQLEDMQDDLAEANKQIAKIEQEKLSAEQRTEQVAAAGEKQWQDNQTLTQTNRELSDQLLEHSHQIQTLQAVLQAVQEQSDAANEAHNLACESNRRELTDSFNSNMELTNNAAELDERCGQLANELIAGNAHIEWLKRQQESLELQLAVSEEQEAMRATQVQEALKSNKQQADAHDQLAKQLQHTAAESMHNESALIAHRLKLEKALVFAKSDMGAMRCQIEAQLHEEASAASRQLQHRHQVDHFNREILDLQRALVGCQCGARNRRSLEKAPAFLEAAEQHSLSDLYEQYAQEALERERALRDGTEEAHVLPDVPTRLYDNDGEPI